MAGVGTSDNGRGASLAGVGTSDNGRRAGLAVVSDEAGPFDLDGALVEAGEVVSVLYFVVGSSGTSALASSASPGFNNEACSIVLFIYGIEIKVMSFIV